MEILIIVPLIKKILTHLYLKHNKNLINIKTKNIVKILFITIFIAFTHIFSISNLNLNDSNSKLVLKEETKNIAFDKKYKRIIVLSLSTARILDSLNLDIVGMVSTERELSKKLAKVPKVGSPIKPNIENILKLNPDLLITSKTFYNVQKDMFSKNNINVLYIDNTTYEDTKNNIKYFGKYFNRDKESKKILFDFDSIEKKIIRKNKNNSSKVIILHANNKEIQIATKYSFAGSIVKKLGIINITDSINILNKNQTYTKLSIEHIAKENPDKILIIIHSKNKNLKLSIKNDFKTNNLWQITKAVQNNKIFFLDEELFYANPGIKCIEALEYLANILYE